MSYAYHPRKLWMDLFVHPEHRGKSIGRSLYEHLRDRQQRFDPVRLIASVREDNPSGRGFIERRGFSEVMRQWENHLDLANWDPSPWAEHVQRATSNGVRLATYAELRSSDPRYLDRLYELSVACGKDVPSPEQHTAPDRDTWMKRNLDNPNLLADGYIVAIDDATGEYVGLSNLWRCQGDATCIETGLTGVRRSHRRRGVAMAMKMRALSWAKETGAQRVKTWNETGNEGMLAINHELGFVKQPAWLDMALDL